MADPIPKLPAAEVHRATWDHADGSPGWQQYHDERDPLPAKWDDEEPDEVRGFYSGEQMHSMYLQGRREALEEAAKECDKQQARSKECSAKADKAEFWNIYHHAATTAGWCAAAIRELSKEKDQ